MLFYFKRILSQYADIDTHDIKRIDRAFHHYTLSSASPHSLLLSLYYHPSEKLAGEIHLDAKILLGIETFVNMLKRHDLVKNEDIPLTSEQLPYPYKQYKQVFLKKDPDLISHDSLSPYDHSISKIELCPEHINLTITGQNLDHFISNLDSFVSSLWVTQPCATKPVLARARL